MPFTYLNPPILALDPFYWGGPITDTAFILGNWQTLAVNQGPRYGTDYPFVDPSSDVMLLLGDLYFAYEDDNCGVELPLRVSWMFGFGTIANGPIPGDYPAPTHELDIIIVDANDQVVFDSTLAGPEDFLRSAWGTSLETVEWRYEAGIVRLTRHTGFPSWYDGTNLNQFITPTNGILDPRSYMRMPRRVKSLRIGLTEMSGDIVLAEGFNIRLTPTEVDNVDGGRFRKQLEIRAVPGDGLGRQDACEDTELVLKRINGVEATEGGDFKLDPEGCYWFKRPAEITREQPRAGLLTAPDLSLVGADYGVNLDQIIDFSNIDTTVNLQLAMESEDSMIQLLNDCSPCCECDDYVRTYRALSNVYDAYVLLGNRASAARDQHEANIARWDSQAACRLANPVRLVIQPLLNGKVVIGAAHCNLTQCCVQNVLLRLTFEAFEDAVATVTPPELTFDCQRTKRRGSDTNYEEVNHVMAGEFPIYDTEFDFSDPQASSKIATLIKVSEAAANQGLRVTLSVHFPAVPQEAGKSCPTVDPTTVEVPAEVQALWNANPAPYPVRGLIQKTVALNDTQGCCN